jgi:hypothetical protein
MLLRQGVTRADAMKETGLEATVLNQLLESGQSWRAIL